MSNLGDMSNCIAPYQSYRYTYGSLTKTTTVREYDEEGRLVKETVTEEVTPTGYTYYPTYPYQPYWTTTLGGGTTTDRSYTINC